MCPTRPIVCSIARFVRQRKRFSNLITRLAKPIIQPNLSNHPLFTPIISSFSEQFAHLAVIVRSPPDRTIMPAMRTHDTPSQCKLPLNPPVHCLPPEITANHSPVSPVTALEVITDTIQPPSLAIISPTPRAFTFPVDKNEHCPYSSPIHSPFEPDLRKLTLTPSQPTLLRTLSPVSPTSSISSGSTSVFSSTSSFTTASSGPVSPSSHKRRKSSICSDIERRPRKGDEDYIKRPENAFILFRRKCCEDRQLAQEEAVSSAYTDAPTKKQRQADLSKTISQQWKALSADERLYWEELAKEKKKEHEQMYPNYVYRPQRSKDKKGKKSKRGEFEHETDCESISFMLPLAPPNMVKHGRSASAPTPPPCRQTIQVPTVYMPSCPTSPSLLPMISRRASHPDHMDSSASHFDFLPSSTGMSQQQYSQHDVFDVSTRLASELRTKANE